MNRTENLNYEEGYRDGFNGHPKSTTFVGESYDLGYSDGVGDAALQVRVEFESEAARPVDDLYYELNAPPEGFVWTGEKRTPVPGDWYLSKNGNGIECVKVRGNNQKRHILRRVW